MTTTMDPAEESFGQIDGAGLLRHEQAGKPTWTPSILRDLILKYLIGCEGFCYTVIEFS